MKGVIKVYMFSPELTHKKAEYRLEPKLNQQSDRRLDQNDKQQDNKIYSNSKNNKKQIINVKYNSISSKYNSNNYNIENNYNMENFDIKEKLSDVMKHQLYRGMLNEQKVWHYASQNIITKIVNKSSDDYANIINFCKKNRNLMRDILVKGNYLQKCDLLEDVNNLYHFSAVDSSIRQINHYSTTHLVAAGFSASLHRNCYEIFYDLHCPNTFSIGILMDYIRTYLEAILLDPLLTSNDQYIILDQSFAVLFSTMYKSVQEWFNYYGEITLSGFPAFDDYFTKNWFFILYNGLEEEGIFTRMFKNTKVVGVTKQATARSILRFIQRKLIQEYNIDSSVLNIINDRRLLDILMEPGEYLIPQPLSMNRNIYDNLFNLYKEIPKEYQKYFRGLLNIYNFFEKETDDGGLIKLENSNFIDNIKESFDSKIYYTYYFPRYGRMVYRLEFHNIQLYNDGHYNHLGNGKKFQEMLNSFNCSLLPEFMEPYNQYLADSTVKREVDHLEKVMNHQITQLQYEYIKQLDNNLSELDYRQLRMLNSRYRS